MCDSDTSQQWIPSDGHRIEKSLLEIRLFLSDLRALNHLSFNFSSQMDFRYNLPVVLIFFIEHTGKKLYLGRIICLDHNPEQALLFE